ncbi:MAG: hypothetical protein ABI597_02630 [Gammaproteobacteria bacterium]
MSTPRFITFLQNAIENHKKGQSYPDTSQSTFFDRVANEVTFDRFVNQLQDSIQIPLINKLETQFIALLNQISLKSDSEEDQSTLTDASKKMIAEFTHRVALAACREVLDKDGNIITELTTTFFIINSKRAKEGLEIFDIQGPSAFVSAMTSLIVMRISQNMSISEDSKFKFLALNKEIKRVYKSEDIDQTVSEYTKLSAYTSVDSTIFDDAVCFSVKELPMLELGKLKTNFDTIIKEYKANFSGTSLDTTNMVETLQSEFKNIQAGDEVDARAIEENLKGLTQRIQEIEMLAKSKTSSPRSLRLLLFAGKPSSTKLIDQTKAILEFLDNFTRPVIDSIKNFAGESKSRGGP